MTMKNPWLGLASYEEPKNDGNDYFFCGREEETLDMVRLIDNNLFITLYGSSGIGKTSLLRAGVIPILRRKDYFPLYVRLSQESTEFSYAEVIVRKLHSSGLTAENGVAMKQADGNDRFYLWNYFATTRFLKDGREVYPVIILDQFEEVFREGDKAKAELLLKQIYLLLNDELEIPDEMGYSADTNYRFVASIREDFLFVLEDSIDELSLDLYKNNRYRLRPMKPEQARQVVLVPGRDCIEESEKNKVADRVVALAKRNKRGDIDTLLLSLVCAGSFDKKSGEKITLPDLAIWKDNPMEVYYQDAIKGLSANQVRYIQQHLIRDDGSRRRVNVEEVKTAFGEVTYRQLTQGKNRLFAIGDKGQVELLHDQLGMAVYEERKGVEEKEKKRERGQKRIRNIGVLVLLIVLGVFITQNMRFKQTRWSMLENQARYIAEKANRLVDEGDSYTAIRMLLDVLPRNPNRPIDRPYTGEAEVALRKACNKNNAILNGHADNVNSASYSLDGKRIVSASLDNTVRIWDAESGAELRTLVGHSSGVLSASFSPDGKRIVSASDDKMVRIWDAETGANLKTLEGHKDRVLSASYSPDGKYIASASYDNTVRIWNAESGAELRTLKGHTSGVLSASYSPDGKHIASASDDKTVRIWDAETGANLKTLEGHKDGVMSASYSPDGKHIVSASLDNTVKMWDTKTATRVLDGHSDWVKSAVFSPDGKLVVSASYDNTAKIWDAETGTELKTLEGHTKAVYSIAFSPDGRHIVSASDDKTVRIWDAEKGLELKTLEGHTKAVYSVAFSPDGRRIVSASDDKTIRIWDVETGTELKTLVGHTRAVSSVAFSPDGRHIVSASHDKTIKIWDTEEGVMLKTFKGHTSWVNSAVFSPDGKRIVSASLDNTVRIWDVKTGSELRILAGHTYCVYSAVFSLNRKQVVSASLDNTIRIWDSETGKELMTLEGHASSVNSATYSPDGKNIVSTSDDGTVRIWPFPPLQDLIDQTRERFKNHPLKQEEKRAYYIE